MTYDAVFRSRDKSRNKSQGRDCSHGNKKHVSTVEGIMQRVTAQHLVKNAKNVAKITTLKPCVKVEIVTLIDMIEASPDQERKAKERNFMKSLKIMIWKI